MLSLLHVQIIIDILLFVVILLLLYQLNKKIKERSPVLEDSTVKELKKIIKISENNVNQFMAAMEDNKQQLNKLIEQLDGKGEKMVLLLKEADGVLEKLSSQKLGLESATLSDKYDDILKMARQGFSADEIAKRSGMTEGEIRLIVELTKTGERDDP